MVRILNGEIVQDDDPRLRQRNQPSTGTASSSAPAAGRIGSVLGQPPQSSSNGQSGGGQPPSQNPLDYIAKILKIEQNVITIPAIDFYQLKLSATRIPLVNFIPIGLLIVIFGWRGVAFSVALFLLYKHSDTANAPQS